MEMRCAPYVKPFRPDRHRALPPVATKDNKADRQEKAKSDKSANYSSLLRTSRYGCRT